MGKHSQGLEHTRLLLHFHALLPYHMSCHTEHTTTHGISRQSGNTHSSKVGFVCSHFLGDVKNSHGSAKGQAKIALGKRWGKLWTKPLSP